MRLPLTLHEIIETPWAIAPTALDAILEAATRDEVGERATRLDRLQERAGNLMAFDGLMQRTGAVEVVNVRGVIVRGSDSDRWGDYTGMGAIADAVRRAATDTNTAAVVLAIDSPGGVAVGMPELASTLRAAAQVKPMFAVASPRAASAAYWIGSQASKLMVESSGDVGSVGVVTSHADYSKFMERVGIAVSFVHAGKYKVEGSPYAPLSDEARAHMQDRVDAIYETFVSDVATGRRRSVEDVRAHFGEGRMVRAPRAVELGMADGIATLDQVIEQANTAAGRQAATLPGATNDVAELLALAAALTHTGGNR